MVNVPLPSEKLLSSSRSVFKPLKKEEDEEDGGRREGEGGRGGEKREDGEEEEYREEDLEEKKEEIEEELVSREEPYGMGLAVALKKLRERGDLELKDEDYSGRLFNDNQHYYFIIFLLIYYFFIVNKVEPRISYLMKN